MPTICPAMLVLGRVYTSIAPIAGTNAAIIVTRHRRLCHFAAIHENRNADIVDMIPVGMFSREVWTAVKPRLLTMIPLNVMRPVLEICDQLTSVSRVANKSEW